MNVQQPGVTLPIGGSDIARTIFQETLAANLTVTNVVTAILTLPSITLELDDIIFLNARWTIVKGVISGNTQVDLEQSAGTAVLNWLNGLGDFNTIYNPHSANIRLQREHSAIVVCTTAGTATLRMSGVSNGSDGTAEANDCGLGALILRANVA